MAGHAGRKLEQKQGAQERCWPMNRVFPVGSEGKFKSGFALLFFKKNILYYYFKICIYVLLAALGLRCCVRAVSSCGEQELLCSCNVFTGSSQRWLLSLQSTGLGTGSVVVTDGLVCSPARGIVLDWGLNLCPRRRQVDSYRLCHQGTPRPFIQMLSFS